MQYPLLVRLIANSKSSEDSISIPRELFQRLLTAALKAKAAFDPEFYLDKYLDVRDAIKAGRIRDAEEHYYQAGFFEGRHPMRILIDEGYYLENNPDVRQALLEGRIQSAQQHFESAGFREGRLPYEGFSLL